MIGGSETRRAGGSVDRERLERALREWEYETSPTAAASLATYLDSLFPDASVDRPGGGDEAAVVVDDVAICFADAFGRRFRTNFHILRESYGGVFCYSISAHTDDPTEWRAFTRRYGSDDVRFVRRPTAEPPEPGLAGPATVAAVPLVMAAITIVLAASTGLLSAGATPIAGKAGLVLAVVGLGALATSLGLFEILRRRQGPLQAA
ncbi:hypothetical protein Halru_0304 [Halovivax ruber XH-70]|uniref:Uncharacterized protein n=2 Tax=Halovivax TaxID=332951 RepID=L0I828_HALRX|nr:hypothetical protein [Halovivax ruber]AGB14948.1 hypothetical protein Halru_0304 [Halovivax ruber XH-70]